MLILQKIVTPDALTAEGLTIISPAPAPAVGKEPAKELTFTVYQDGASFQLRTPIKDDSAQQVIGNVINALYRWVNLQRAFKSKGLKLSKPIGIRMRVGGNLWDTGLMDMTFTERLKLQDTPQGRVSFAQKMFALYLHTTYRPGTISHDENMCMLRASAAMHATEKKAFAAVKAA